MRLRLVALKELPKKRFDIFMIDIHTAKVYQKRMKISISLTLILSHQER
jgi:hypothetical protein